MKVINKCKSCGKDFECTRENEVQSEPRSNFEQGTLYECLYCKHIDPYPLTSESMHPFTLDETILIVKDLISGKNNKYLHGKVDLKIGDYKKCDDCGNITNVVAYNGLFEYDANCSTLCECSSYAKHDDWYEPCGTSTCNDVLKCDFHKGIDTKKERTEHEDFTKRRSIVKSIFNAFPPKNDGILELDRMAYMFGAIYGEGSINDNRSWVFDDFMLYCARNNIIQK